MYDKFKLIMLEAGFDLRKCETNDSELKAYISLHETTKLDTEQLRGDDMTLNQPFHFSWKLDPYNSVRLRVGY